MALRIGDRVRVSKNDAKVAPGSTGRYIGVSEDSGNLLVDIDGRGTVSFTKDSVMTMQGAAVTVAQRTGDQANGHAKPEKLKLSRPLYLDGPDTAAELGVARWVLKTMADTLSVGECNQLRCHFTARDIAYLMRFQTWMKRMQIKQPKLALRVLTEIRELTGRDPLAPE